MEWNSPRRVGLGLCEGDVRLRQVDVSPVDPESFSASGSCIEEEDQQGPEVRGCVMDQALCLLLRDPSDLAGRRLWSRATGTEQRPCNAAWFNTAMVGVKNCLLRVEGAAFG